MTPIEKWDPEILCDHLADLMEELDRRTDYGENLDVLTEAERIIYLTQNVEMEVNNGGFAQYFLNTAFAYIEEIADAYRTLGAPKAAEVCSRAVEILMDKVDPETIAELDLIEGFLSIAHHFDAVDDAFGAYPEDLSQLTYEFILGHKDDFRM